MNWSSRSLATAFHHGVFRVLVRCRLLAAARMLLTIVVAYYSLLPHVRRRALPYVTRRFHPASWLETQHHVWRLYKTFGDILLSRTAAGVTGETPSGIHPDDLEKLASAVQEGHGCIVLSAHVGEWQLGLAGIEQLGAPIHILQHRDPGDVDRHYFEGHARHDVSIIDSAGPFGGMLECAAALQGGGIVCIMGDRLVSDHEPGLMHPFLGGNVRFPLAPYALASLSGAPLAITFSVLPEDACGKELRGRIADVLHVPPGLRRNPRDMQPFLHRYVLSLEQFILEHPYQFFNFYDMWADHDKTGTD